MSCNHCRGTGHVPIPCPDNKPGCCVAHYARCPQCNKDTYHLTPKGLVYLALSEVMPAEGAKEMAGRIVDDLRAHGMLRRKAQGAA